MKVRHHHDKPQRSEQRTTLANLSLGKLEVSNEEILADLRYPAAPSRDRRR